MNNAGITQRVRADVVEATEESFDELIGGCTFSRSSPPSGCSNKAGAGVVLHFEGWPEHERGGVGESVCAALESFART